MTSNAAASVRLLTALWTLVCRILTLEHSALTLDYSSVSSKKERLLEMVRGFEGRPYDAHYLVFFECFNSGRFYEAHEVLEQIWLPQRREPNGNFYKALIQIAGAFVHLQKGRSQPAGALLRLAKANLEAYPPVHEGLDLANVRSLIGDWLLLLEGAGSGTSPSGGCIPNPKLELT